MPLLRFSYWLIMVRPRCVQPVVHRLHVFPNHQLTKSTMRYSFWSGCEDLQWELRRWQCHVVTSRRLFMPGPLSLVILKFLTPLCAHAGQETGDMSRLDSPQGESHTHSSSLIRRGDLNLVPWAPVDNYVKQSGQSSVTGKVTTVPYHHRQQQGRTHIVVQVLGLNLLIDILLTFITHCYKLL